MAVAFANNNLLYAVWDLNAGQKRLPTDRLGNKSPGECIVITRHGTAIAVLQPLEHGEKADPAEVIAEILKFREQHALDGLTVRQLIEEGRR